MTDRNLPEWMSNNESTALKQAQSQFHKRNVIEEDLPYLEFTGTVIYSHEKNDCSFLSQDLRAGLEPSSAIGFDIEWPPCFLKGQKKKVALIQLCTSEDKCYLFHLSSMTGFPTGLKLLLEDESVIKVGVGIEGDMWKLLSDFSIKMTNFVELGDLANEKLRCVEKWSLAGLVMHLFRKRLFKSKHVRCSNWDNLHLSEDQKRYAATDAYAGLIIYNKLLNWDLGAENSRSGLKDKLSQMASEMASLAGRIYNEVNDMERASKLVEDMSASFNSLKDILIKSNNTACSSPQELLPLGPESSEVIGCSLSDESSRTHAQDGDDVDLNQSNLDLFKAHEPVKNVREASYWQKEGIMSLDISEYELQMLEMQANEEHRKEQSTLDLKEKNTLENSADLSHDVASDEELENQMLQCVEEAEELSLEENKTEDEQKDLVEPSSSPEEEEDVIEEEEEEFDPSFPEPNPDHIKCLKMNFGHSCFKPVQWKVIHSVIKERRDNLVVMATGYGKSLCFQFPPVYCGGLSVVISPLIALMEDQVLQLQMSNIPACFLGSAQTKNVLLDVKQGKYKVVFITPEYCSGSISLLEQLNTTIGISLIAVDEAHCISEWGHDFRGAYRNLGKLKRCMPNVPIIALTATASPSIRMDIVRSLNLVDPVITCTSFDRPNLFLEVGRKSGNMMEDMKRFLRKKPGGDYEFEGPSIVYCPSRKEAERVSIALYKLGITGGLYHAGLGIKQRRESQHSFMRDEIQCIVATVAFGMGINKLDIRKVIHYGAPKEMESYYQEIGRAGRDGLPSACHVLWTPGDMTINRFFLNQGTNTFRPYKLKMMVKMEQYLKSYKCRRKLILSHFEDKQLRKVTSGIKGTYQCCDNCKSGLVNIIDESVCDGGLGGGSRHQDFGPLVFQLLSAVAAMGERYGTTTPILFLRGSNSQRVPKNYRCHPLFGGGKGIPEACWKALAKELLIEDLLQEYTGSNKFCTLCRITFKGKMWFNQAQDETKRSLLLQPNRELSTWSVQRRKPSLAPTSNIAAGRQSSTVAQNRLTASHSGNIGSKVYEKHNSSSGRFQSLVPKLPPDPVYPRELQLQGELYAKLVAERQKLASEKDIPPAILATNKILLDMAKIRPCTVSDLKLVDGVSEAKSSMLAPLLKTIVNCLSAVHREDSSSLLSRPHPFPLPDSVNITYRLFQEQGQSMKHVCDARSLPSAVVESHLLQAFRADLPLDMDRAGLTPAIRDAILSIVQSAPINSNLNDIKAIRARIPEDISPFLFKLTVAMLQRDEVHTAPSAVPICPLQPGSAAPPQSQQSISWIEPEEVTPSSIRNVPSTSEASTPKTTLQTGAIMLASWNYKSPDEDTQDIFKDSSVKNLSQPSKRKLPDWSEVLTGPTLSAAMKKAKKKKGLFS
ncbi:Werner syndrome ATP-dependent helicase homolog isoform X2 [Hypomesus transpacificus]|uniref:Werner syndrome ATP-dependent helicase homolog isoform X2 n=1 Tax=Hypomesus transpacificus TaxID=137520 RepID=UPI001F07A34F|nr:Werner syndrome ATP-dependent helicase homolog isoform X2 [Hypomesus transpacificus]